MSVIEEVLEGLDSLKSNNPGAVVDMLCKLHDTNGASISSVLGIAKQLSDKAGGRNPSSEQDSTYDPFPDFSDERANSKRIGGNPNSHNSSVNRESFMLTLEQTMLSYQELLEKHNRDFDAIHAERKAGRAESEDETIARLRDAQLALLKYPIAGQAIYAALIREGRQFARTEQGAAMQKQLGNSPTVAKARTLFEGLSGGMMSEHNSELPSTYIDGFLDALDRDLEIVLGELGDVDGIL